MCRTTQFVTAISEWVSLQEAEGRTLAANSVRKKIQFCFETAEAIYVRKLWITELTLIFEITYSYIVAAFVNTGC